MHPDALFEAWHKLRAIVSREGLRGKYSYGDTAPRSPQELMIVSIGRDGKLLSFRLFPDGKLIIVHALAADKSTRHTETYVQRLDLDTLIPKLLHKAFHETEPTMEEILAQIRSIIAEPPIGSRSTRELTLDDILDQATR